MSDTGPRIIAAAMSEDGSTKYLWRLVDGQTVESVYLPLMDRGAAGPSMCISSQVGCAVRCTFCATGRDGLARNLTVDEIAGQVHGILDELGIRSGAFDVSFMGMGEPLHNLSAIKAAVSDIVTTHGQHNDVHFSLSTVGVSGKLQELAEVDQPISLQVSLHGTTDELRARLMPSRSRMSIEDLLAAARYYADIKNDVVNVNYLLFDGLNDTTDCAVELVRLIGEDRRFRLKLSHYNPISGSDLNPTDDEKKERFLALCREHGLRTFSWRSMGRDIGGGCGQLRSNMASGTG